MFYINTFYIPQQQDIIIQKNEFLEILPYNKYNDLSDRTYDDIDTADKNIKKMAELLSFNYKRQISEKQRKILVERLRKARFIHNIFTKMRLNGVEEIILSL